MVRRLWKGLAVFAVASVLLASVISVFELPPIPEPRHAFTSCQALLRHQLATVLPRVQPGTINSNCALSGARTEATMSPVGCFLHIRQALGEMLARWWSGGEGGALRFCLGPA